MAELPPANPNSETDAANAGGGAEEETSVPQKTNPDSSSNSSSAAAQEDLLHEVRNLMRRITAARPSPHPRFLHTLAAILEEEEELYVFFCFRLLPLKAISSVLDGKEEELRVLVSFLFFCRLFPRLCFFFF